MASKRMFYRSVITVEVLSEEQLWTTDLRDIAEECMSGELSGMTLSQDETEVDGPEMAKLLLKQGSDPEFFRLDEQGNDLDDEEGD